MRRLIVGAATHAIALGIGFALGIYLLPILTAPDSPDAAMLEEMAQDALYTAELTRDLRGSDFLHWGEGTISVSPGPDYKVYLVDRFVEHEDEFLPIKSEATVIGDVKTFEGFLLDIPAGIDIAQYNTVLVWCEAFDEFITAAQYR